MDKKELEKHAENGSAWHQWELANCFRNNETDYKTMFYWLQKSANQGFAEAQCDLGVMYVNGFGMRKNYKKAFYWTEKSAMQGCHHAMYRLAILYYEGKGTPKDYQKAFSLLKEVAKGSSAVASDAKANLGVMYYEGKGTQRDYKKAIYYTKQANTFISKRNLKIMEGNDFYEGFNF